MNSLRALAFGVAAMPAAVLAEQAVAACPSHAQPDWIENLAPDQAHHGLLLQQMYRANTNASIVEYQTCSCTVRYPLWDSSEQAYFENYSDLDKATILEAASNFQSIADDNLQEARTLCEAVGHW
ncbi:MAG: hypothetical protein ABJM43_04385 [Paracoccaceae bacterium]